MGGYCDYLYGTPRAFVEEMVAQGKIVISDIDIQGAEQLRRTMPDGVFIFLMPPSLEELRRRIMRRATDSPEAMLLHAWPGGRGDAQHRQL